MLAHRRRRWANIKSTLVQRLVFAGPGKGQALDSQLLFVPLFQQSLKASELSGLT